MPQEGVFKGSTGFAESIPLTAQERRLLVLAASGSDLGEMASRLKMSQTEAATLRERLITKLLDQAPARNPTPHVVETAANPPSIDTGPIMDVIESAVPDHEEWLITPNPVLMWRTPAELIEKGEEEPIRAMIRSAVYIGVS